MIGVNLDGKQMNKKKGYHSGYSFINFVTSVPDRKGHKVSQITFARTERTLKIFVYLLSVNMKMTARMISRFFKIDKDTVKAWVKEVKTWPEPERNAVVSELITGKRLPDKDVYDDKFKLQPLKEEDQYPE